MDRTLEMIQNLRAWKESALEPAQAPMDDPLGCPPRISTVEAFAKYRKCCEEKSSVPFTRYQFTRWLGKMGIASGVGRFGKKTARALEYVRWRT